MKRRVALILPLVLASVASRMAEASDHGCEVLLCAASSNPSWRAVKTCQRPMEKLISDMKQPGFSWPICEGANTGAPGYVRYADCEAGWVPASDHRDHGTALGSDQSRCSRTVNQCANWRSFFGSGGNYGAQVTANGVTRTFTNGNSCQYTESKARPLREAPYYFDIGSVTADRSTRVWFGLGR